MGLINDYLEYHRLKKYLKKLARWERQMMKAGLPPIPPDFNAISKGKAMDNKQARYLHRMLDRLAEGQTLKPEEIQSLRKSLPEPPAQKTLEEITEHVYDAWTRTNYNEWAGNIDNPNILLEEWLVELHVQLKGLKDTPAAVPTLPAGMRIADHENFGRVVVSPGVTGEGFALILALNDTHGSGAMWRHVEPDSLTFIDEDPAHPEFLETEADYRDAPEGTVAARGGWLSWIKEGANYWTCSVGAVGDCSMTQSQPRRVLRWGWGE